MLRSLCHGVRCGMQDLRPKAKVSQAVCVRWHEYSHLAWLCGRDFSVNSVSCVPTVWMVWIRHMPCCMPASACVLDKNLRVCVCVSAQVQSGTHSISSLPAFPDSSRMTNSKGEAPADGIWECQDNAAGFQTWLGFRRHVTTVELGTVPRPFFTSVGISSLGNLVCRIFNDWKVLASQLKSMPPLMWPSLA